MELPVTSRGVSIILFALLAATPERDLPFKLRPLRECSWTSFDMGRLHFDRRSRAGRQFKVRSGTAVIGPTILVRSGAGAGGGKRRRQNARRRHSTLNWAVSAQR
jgi:hypothetical protein